MEKEKDGIKPVYQHNFYNKEVEKNFTHIFEIKKDIVCLIEITASARSWRQNFVKFRLGDDDLAIKVDGRGFPKFSGARGLFNAEAAWNGNKLKGLSQTNLFLVRLNKGNHGIEFLANQKPKLGKLVVYEVKEAFFYTPPNPRAEDGNRRPWITLASKNIAIKNLTVAAKADEGKSFLFFRKDDSDLKLVIDGEIQKNETKKSHRHWYWCGKILKGNNTDFNKAIDLRGDKMHYLEFFADRTPEIESIILKIDSNVEYTESDIQTYSYKGTNGKENYNRFNTEILSVVNEWNKEFFKQKNPPSEPLHPNLVKAIIYIESRMGYYEPPAGYYPAYPDVMQIADPRNPAIHTLNNDNWIDPNTNKISQEYEWKNGKAVVLDCKGEANAGDAAESIKWGVRWLYHKAQGITDDGDRFWRTWREAVRNYNSAGNAKYEKDVYGVYENGIDSRKKPVIKLFIAILAFLGILSGGTVLAYTLYENQERTWLTFDETGEDGVEYVLNLDIFSGISTKKYEVAKNYDNGVNFDAIERDTGAGWNHGDIIGPGQRALIVYGSGITGSEIRYVFKETKDGPKLLYNIGEHHGPAPAFQSHVVDFIDTDGDDIYEVREAFYLHYTNTLDEIWTSWYRYNVDKEIYEFYKKEQMEATKSDLWGLFHKEDAGGI